MIDRATIMRAQEGKRSRWAWLLQSPSLADVELRFKCLDEPTHAPAGLQSPVRAPQPACSSNSCSATYVHTSPARVKDEPGTQDESVGASARSDSHRVVAAIPAHAAALASASEYWKARILHWNDHESSTSARKRVKRKSSSPNLMVFDEYINDSDLPVVEAAISFAYTEAVPTTASELLQGARLACQWEMPDYLEACLKAVGELPPNQVTLEVLNAIFSDDLPNAVLDSPGYRQQVMPGICKAALLHMFGKPQAVICNSDKLRTFCGLPFQAVCQWASYTELQVDSENSVAVLLSSWWSHNQQALNGSARTACRQQLSSLLRVQYLSDSFLTVVESLPWFLDPTPGFIKSLLLMRRVAAAAPRTLPGVPPAWTQAPPRRPCEKTAVTVSEPWVLHRSQLMWLHEQAKQRQVELTSPGIYWKGYIWHMKLGLASCNAPLYLGITVSSPAAQTFSVPMLIPATFKLACENHQSGMAYVETCDFSDGMWQSYSAHGSGNLLDVPRTERPREHSLPPPYMMPDDHLHLRLVMVTAN